MSSSSKPRRRGSRLTPSDAFDDEQSAGISGDIAFLGRLVHELEEQLRRLGSMNDALEHDLARERTQSAHLHAAVEGLEKRISAVGDSRPDSQALLESISRASTERADLAIRNRLLEQRLHDLSAGHATRERERRVLREELGETAVELGLAESQLSRALATVEAIELQVKAATSERDRLQDAVHAGEERVAAVRRERDALLADVADSREALHKLKRSLAGRL